MDNKYEHVLMLVDDEQSILSSLKRLFRNKGYQILTAASGRQGLETLEGAEKRVSLIISDQRMPDMTGVRFLEQAKKIFPDAIRFLLTGYADMEAVIDAVNLGEIHRYLTKPWDDDDLLLQVQQALQQYELVAENLRLTKLTRKQNARLNELNRGLEKKVAERTLEITKKNKKLNEINLKLEKSVTDTVRLLSSFIQNSNQWLGKYMNDTAQLAGKIARDFGLEEKEIEAVETAAMIHDLGLIGFPSAIRRKDEKEMTADEFKAYSHHPVIASVCLETVERLNAIGEMILCHHEHVDGSGFPSGLKGEEIPLGARIIGPVGDYFRSICEWPDSLTKIMAKAVKLIGPQAGKLTVGDDHHKLIWKLKEEILRSRSGTIYDPEVISKLLDQLSFDDRRESKGPSHLVHYNALESGMMLARVLRTMDGRFVLAPGTKLNEKLIYGIKRLAAGQAIEEEVCIYTQ